MLDGSLFQNNNMVVEDMNIFHLHQVTKLLFLVCPSKGRCFNQNYRFRNCMFEMVKKTEKKLVKSFGGD